MRRTTTCLLLIITVFNASLHAQFKKGMQMPGITLGSSFFSSGKYTYTVPPPTNGSTESTNSMSMSLTPNYGWFISDHTAVGVQLSVGYKYDKNIKADANNVTYYKNEFKRTTILAGAFARNYFPAVGSFLPFVQAGLSAGFGSSNHEGFNYNNSPLYKEVFEGKSSGDISFNAGLSVGLTKMFNSTIGLDIIAGYIYSYNKNEYSTTINRDINIDGTVDETSKGDLTTRFTNHGFSIGAGFQVFLFRNKK
jgi:hypothetical protein